MRLIVCGGRTFGGRPDQAAPGGWVRFLEEADLLFNSLDRVLRKRSLDLIIEGGAGRRDPRTRGIICGADLLAREWAERSGIPVHEEIADWKGRGRAAGPERNSRMLRLIGQDDGVLAMPGQNGTQNMVDQALAAGVKVWRPYPNHSVDKAG